MYTWILFNSLPNFLWNCMEYFVIKLFFPICTIYISSTNLHLVTLVQQMFALSLFPYGSEMLGFSMFCFVFIGKRNNWVSSWVKMFLCILGFIMDTVYLNYCGPLWVYVVLWSYLRAGNTFHDLRFRKISHFFVCFILLVFNGVALAFHPICWINYSVY